MTPHFFTIGHSSRPLTEFIDLLREAGIERLADVRKMPMSRSNPQFNSGTLPEALAGFQISYEHIAQLGGLRGKAHALPADVNGLWKNRSFHNYADYALSQEFHQGLERLLDGREQRCAIMCSEAVWWRCHRRIVADYLIASKASVFHIMGEGRIEPAHLTPGAVIQADGRIVYPAPE